MEQKTEIPIEELINFLVYELKRFRTRKFIKSFKKYSTDIKKICSEIVIHVIHSYPVVSRYCRKIKKRFSQREIIIISILLYNNRSRIFNSIDLEKSVSEKIDIERLQNNINKNIWDRYYHPKWLYDLYCRNFGSENAEYIMNFNNKLCDQTILIPDRKNYNGINNKLTGLTGTGLTEITENLFTFPLSPLEFNLENTREFIEGKFHHSSIPAWIMTNSVKNSQTVLDICSHPGGKSLTLLSHNRDIKLFAMDINHAKCVKLLNNLHRNYGPENIYSVTHKGESPPFKKEIADLVICDVPCSGTGIIRRRPELRWRIKKTDILKNNSIQRNILEKSSFLLKRGGYLVYSTCSIAEEENFDQISLFLEKNRNFSIFNDKDKSKPLFSKDFSNHETITPHQHNLDGFYYIILKKN